MAPKKDNQEANPAMLNGMDPVIVNYVDAKGKPAGSIPLVILRRSGHESLRSRS